MGPATEYVLNPVRVSFHCLVLVVEVGVYVVQGYPIDITLMISIIDMAIITIISIIACSGEITLSRDNP